MHDVRNNAISLAQIHDAIVTYFSITHAIADPLLYKGLIRLKFSKFSKTLTLSKILILVLCSFDMK